MEDGRGLAGYSGWHAANLTVQVSAPLLFCLRMVPAWYKLSHSMLLPCLVVCCSLAPSTLVVLPLSSKVAPSIFRADSSQLDAARSHPSGRDQTARATRNERLTPRAWGNPASHILL